MYQNWIVLLFLMIIAGIGKAMRDTISFHWDRSVFSKIKNERWRRWFESDMNRRPDHPIWFLWDGWHFGDTLSYVGIFLAIIFVITWWQVIMCAALFGILFQLFYQIIFLARA